MNECSSEIGLNSIYSALTILWNAEHSKSKVYLHCHAGINRSQTIGDAYYFMRTKTHRQRPNKNNRLIENIEQGCLPAKNKIETFLGKLEFALRNQEKYLGGMLDWLKEESNIK